MYASSQRLPSAEAATLMRSISDNAGPLGDHLLELLFAMDSTLSESSEALLVNIQDTVVKHDHQISNVCEHIPLAEAGIELASEARELFQVCLHFVCMHKTFLCVCRYAIKCALF